MPKKKIIGVTQRGQNSYRINYRDKDGNRYFETVEADTIEDAADVRRVRLGDIAKGLPVFSKPNTVKFEELAADVVNDYIVNNHRSTNDIEARYRLHLLPAFGHMKAAQITTPHFKAYIVARKNEGAKPETIKRELEAARRAFLLAKKATPPKVLHVPHIPMPKEKSVRKGFFEREQLEAICRHLPPHLVPVAKFGFITGWRHGEVVSRCWSHIDFSDGEVRMEPGETKNGEGRTFPMVPELKAVLESIRPNGQVFPGARVFTNNGEPINRFDKAWATACRKAGLPVQWVPKRNKQGAELKYKRGPRKGNVILVCRAALYFHDFRRTAYRNLVRMGIPESVARKAVGWLDAKTADRYNITAKADLDVIREKFESGAKYGANRSKTGQQSS